MRDADGFAAAGLAVPGVALPPPAGIRDVAELASNQFQPNAYCRLVKPVIDVLGAAALLILVAPLLAVTALVVRIDAGGPVLFRQTRIGRNGVPFTVYKLRTMREDPRFARSRLFPGEGGRIVHKAEDDPRITRSGRVLRKYSIDELPQLWNVLRGQMSLVGPRPELPEIVERYQSWQARRHVVKPGLTGLWQVSVRSRGLMHEHTELDLEYIDRLSLARDVKLVLWTVPAVLGRRPGI